MGLCQRTVELNIPGSASFLQQIRAAEGLKLIQAPQGLCWNHSPHYQQSNRIWKLSNICDLMLSSQNSINIKIVIVPSKFCCHAKTAPHHMSYSSRDATMMYLMLQKLIVMPGCRICPHPWLSGAELQPPAGWLEALLEAFPPAWV